MPSRKFCDPSGAIPKIDPHPEMPTGPLNRVADNALAKKLLGWEPKVMFMDGLAPHHRVVCKNQETGRSSGQTRGHTHRKIGADNLAGRSRL